MTEHHDNAHNLTAFIGGGIAIGAGIGAALGVAMDNIALGVSIGPAIGLALAVGFWSLRQTPADRDDASD